MRPRTNARVTRFRWSTLQARGTLLETPGTAGRHHGPSDKGPRPRTAGRPRGPSGTVPNHPGELFNPAGNRTRVTRPRELLVPAGHWTQAEWPVRAGQTSCPGRSCRPSDPRQSRPGYLVDPRGLGSWPESPGRADRPRGLSDPGPSRLEQLVDPVGPWTQARVTRDSWSTPQALGAGPESPGTSG